VAHATDDGYSLVPRSARVAGRRRRRGTARIGPLGEPTVGQKALSGRAAVAGRGQQMSVSPGGRRVPLGVGAAAGALAWLLGYLLTYVATSGRIREFQGSFLGGVADLFGLEVPTWKIVGWVFYNAHFVDTAAGSGTGSAVGGDGFTALLYALPPVVLLAAGLAVGRAAGSGDAATDALAGASVLIGYLPLSILGVLLFETTIAGTTVAPALVPGVLLAGVLYPAVFGAVGAGLAALTADGGGSTAPQL
jgi:hypothetical protein